METLKAAVIGVGNMGQHHARVYHELDNVELVGIADRDAKRGKQIAELRQTNYYNDCSELIEKEKPECVSIAVPTRLHPKIACGVLRNCNALLEKPIALSLGEAKKIIQASEKSGKRLMVGHIERFNPVISYLKRYLEEFNERILALNIMRLGISPPKNPSTGVVLDLGIHDIDLVRFLTNEKVLFGSVRKEGFGLTEFEDHAHIFLKTRNSSASIVVNWINPRKIRHMYVTLEKAFMYLNYITQEIEIFEKESSDSILSDALFTKKIELERIEPLKLEIQEFLSAVSKNREPGITGKDAMETLCTALNLEEAK